MKAIFHYDAGPRLAARLTELANDGFHVTACPEDDDARLAALLADAEILLHVLRPVTEAVIARAPALRFIQKIGVGVNTIDLDAARARGIAVCNMPGTNTPAVAEAALLLMLATLRNVAALDRACRSGQGWTVGPGLQERVGELRGRLVGLVGAGMVPHALVPMLQGFGARAVYWSPHEHPELGTARCELDTLLATADIVSLHVPLVADTEKMIDAAALARMKPGAILVNTARGGLIDEAALVKALRSGRLRAAGLDVFAAEPVAPDNPLLALDNVVLMPHVAWLTPKPSTAASTSPPKTCAACATAATCCTAWCEPVSRLTWRERESRYGTLAALAVPVNRPARLR